LPQCLRLEHDGIESKSILLGYDDPSYSAMRKPSRKVFYSAMRGLLLGHEEAESESLLLGCGDASHSAMTKSSRKVSYSAMRKSSRKVFYTDAATRPTQP